MNINELLELLRVNCEKDLREAETLNNNISDFSRGVYKGSLNTIDFIQKEIESDYAISNKVSNRAKKDMIVDLDAYTIDIPDLGCINIKVILDAYERIQQRIGIEEARLNGIHLGRPKEDIPEEFIHYYNLVESKSISVVDAVAQMGISRATYYRYKEKYESCK